MTSTIVTEGKIDEMILRTILQDQVADDAYSIVVAGGRSPAVSTARSLLVRGVERLALVVDADTSDADEVLERRRSIERLVYDYAEPEQAKLFIAVPEIEAWLLTDRFLKRTLEHPGSERDKAEARRNPKRFLRKLLGISERAVLDPARFTQVLSKIDLKEVRRQSPVSELVEFLNQVALQR